MRPRQSLVEIFSTFLQFDADRFSGWMTDPKLRRSMESSLAKVQQSETSESFWVFYWYKVWQSPPVSQARDIYTTTVARSHLAAYLQEVCYWAAQKTVTANAHVQCQVSDCFQIAIAQIDKILNGYNPDQGFSLKSYASAIFGGVIRDNLRQRGEVDLCTPWSMLRKLSHTRLVESLQLAGLTDETIASYVLAWTCFKTIYVPTKISVTRKLPRPDSATWEAIASLYNTQRHQQPNLPKGVVNPETIEKWLLSCVKAARDYLYPPVTSINTPATGQESGELLDILPGGESESLLTELIAQEEEQSRNEKKAQIHEVLVTAIQKLEPQAQKILLLYYGQGLTQKQLEQQLEIKQYTISRRLTQARKSLLLTLAQWSRDTLHISLSSDVLKDSNIFLEEWLQLYYSHPDKGF